MEKYSPLYFALQSVGAPRGCIRQQNQTERGESAISYLVCHMEKYHKTDIAPIEKENERDETYEAKNPQINRNLTIGNYHILRR